MDRISDSGSDGCGSNPHGGTEMGGLSPPISVPYLQTPQSPFQEDDQCLCCFDFCEKSRCHSGTLPDGNLASLKESPSRFFLAKVFKELSDTEEDQRLQIYQ